MSSFIKVTATYPVDTIREKSGQFKGASIALSFVLAAYIIAISIGYYQIGLSEYLGSWEGKISSIEMKDKDNTTSVVSVERPRGDKPETLKYEMNAIRASALKKDMPVRKPFLYSETLFGSDGTSFSVVISDFLFFLMGVFIFLFALICGSSFMTIIFASVFMLKPKYAKEK